MEWRHTLVRGDRFALTAEFAAHTGYRRTQPVSAHAHT
jgi:GntR family transcriptional regulator